MGLLPEIKMDWIGLDKFFMPKTRILGLSIGEDFVILSRVVFTQCQRVTDRQANRQTDGFPIIASTGLAATLTPCKNANKLNQFIINVTYVIMPFQATIN